MNIRDLIKPKFPIKVSHILTEEEILQQQKPHLLKSETENDLFVD